MVLVIGFIVVIASAIVGLLLGGGNPMVLLHLSEFVVVLGICLGILIIASPIHTLKAIVGKTMTAFRGGKFDKKAFRDLLKLLYQLFLLARKEGLIALEDHIADPRSSSIIGKYPSFLKDEKAVEFLVNTFQPMVDGKVKPEQLSGIVNTEMEALQKEADEPVHVLSLVGDSFPGVGICAAVLGIILTMGHVGEGAEAVGYKVAAALTGTFLGVYGAYGFINPLTALITTNNETEMRYYNVIAVAACGFTSGQAPLFAVEMARRTLPSSQKPGADELEKELKTLTAPSR